MRNDVFFAITATLLAGIASALLLWLDRHQTYLNSHLEEISDVEHIELVDHFATSPLKSSFDHRSARPAGLGAFANGVDDAEHANSLAR